ncbi:YdcF family protein (plasmid) [Priestia megaterium]|uniref:YdcF family protein n=1 Tax=Priestia megaterium TaxID=1404 RepID=A0A6M6DZV7_PRIMG|nr:YdcF family protein [Priestia megaterium]
MKRLVVKMFFTILGVAVLLTSYLGYSILAFTHKNELVKADAAIVLGAAAWGDKPSPVLRERINHSIWLYKHGYVKKIIFTGGKGEGSPYAESEVAKKYAIGKGIPKSAILIEIKSKITEENLEYAFNISKKHNLKTMILVSDPLHMKRSIVMAHTLGMTVYSSPTQTSVYKSFKSKTTFFFRELFFYEGYLITYPFRNFINIK